MLINIRRNIFAGIYLSILLGNLAIASGARAADTPAATAPPIDKATAPTPTAASAPVSVPLTVASSGKFCVDVTIDGKGPYSLLVDTGTETMVLKSSVAKACGLTVKTGTIEVQGPTGGFVPVGQADIETATVAGITMKHPVCTVEDADFPYDGIIGAPMFNAGVVKLDLAGKKLTTYAVDAFAPEQTDIALPILFGSQRVPVVGGTIGGTAANLEIDTGSSFPAELNADFIDSHKLRDLFVKIGSVSHSSVSGTATSDIYDCQSLKLGDNDIPNQAGKIPTLFLTNKAKRKFDGRVGCPLLSASVLTFDYQHSKMYITPQVEPPTITL